MMFLTFFVATLPALAVATPITARQSAPKAPAPPVTLDAEHLKTYNQICAGFDSFEACSAVATKCLITDNPDLVKCTQDGKGVA